MRGLIKVTFGQCIKTIRKKLNTNRKFLSTMSNLHTNFRLETWTWTWTTPRRRQVVHPWPPTPHGESVAKSETLLLIILSIIYKYDVTEVHANLSNPFFKKKARGRNHTRQVGNCRNSSPYIRHFILSKYWQHQGPDRAHHHRPSLSSSVNTNTTKW